MIINRRTHYENVLDIPEAQSGDYAIVHKHHPARHKFILANARTKIMGGHAGGDVSYTHPTRWHQLTEGNGVWMSDYPIEQAQHDVELADFRHGSVLVGGLGLGYATTALARRDGIKRVVVVEVSPDVVALVEPHLLRDDPAARAKVTVVTADLFDYLDDLPQDLAFDRAFYDIWASDGESTFFSTVIPLLRRSARRVGHVPVCWNESVMRGQLYHSLMGRHATASPKYRHHFPDARTLTLDQLAEARGNVWRDWSVPFFQWVVKRERTDEQVELMAGVYASGYGRPNFSAKWQQVAGVDVPDLDEAILGRE